MSEILRGLPGDFPAPVVVAQHRAATDQDILVGLLAARTKLQVRSARPVEWLCEACVYVCPPGRHMEMASERLLHTWEGPRIGYVRPSCDLMFRSVAQTVGKRAICVVLTGAGVDGAMATRRVRAAGGFVIAQDHNSAAYPDMPAAAVELGSVDLVLPLKDIAFALSELVAAPGAVGV